MCTDLTSSDKATDIGFLFWFYVNSTPPLASQPPHRPANILVESVCTNELHYSSPLKHGVWSFSQVRYEYAHSTIL
jgi:hypothetical protein